MILYFIFVFSSYLKALYKHEAQDASQLSFEKVRGNKELESNPSLFFT